MEKRINVYATGRAAVKALATVNSYIRTSSIEKALMELVEFRVSQINGCPYCLDLHYKEARAGGETEQRIVGVSAWRESPYYSERERAAFEWAETVTAVIITDEIYDRVKLQFSEQELIDLTVGIISVNGWNRLNIAFPLTAGSYKVGMFG